MVTVIIPDLALVTLNWLINDNAREVTRFFPGIAIYCEFCGIESYSISDLKYKYILW